MKITFGLSTKEINQAIKELDAVKRNVNQKAKDLVRKLTDRGVEIAKVKIQEMDAVYLGELLGSIEGYFSESSGIGIIHTGNAWHAIFVEFGTGIVGENNPHPLATEHGWDYDVNNHGEKGWFYPTDDPNLAVTTTDDGQMLGWTRGMAHRPFMYETQKQLEEECERIAKEVFKL